MVSRQTARCAVLEVLQPAAAGLGDVAHDIRVVELGARFRHAPTPVPLSLPLLNGRLGRRLVNVSLIRPTRCQDPALLSYRRPRMRSLQGRPSGSYKNRSSSDAHARSARVTSVNWWGTTRPGGRGTLCASRCHAASASAWCL